MEGGEEGGGGGQWAWSRGEEAQQSQREERQRRKREREAELLRPEAGSAVQQGAVRTQWERRLESQAQGFLQQVDLGRRCVWNLNLNISIYLTLYDIVYNTN